MSTTTEPCGTCTECGPLLDDMCGRCYTNVQRGFAADHVRKGAYDETDLALLGITKEEAESHQRERQCDQLRAAIIAADVTSEWFIYQGSCGHCYSEVGAEDAVLLPGAHTAVCAGCAIASLTTDGYRAPIRQRKAPQ